MPVDLDVDGAVDVRASSPTEQTYRRRLSRYVTALRNETPDAVPIRPFVAEFTGTYAGFDCQQLTHDYHIAFEAARRCAADFDWDAVVPNMVYVWTGLTQALGLRYYGVPGLDVDPNMGFQYREPPENDAWMTAEDYDALIEDPTGYLLHVWLPRVTADVARPGTPATERGTLALIKGAMAMSEYFAAFGPQIQRLREESGTVSAIAGIYKAPMDILADKLRGYLGLVQDLHERRDKVVAACEALMPHLAYVARTTADPSGLVPIGYWMHRGGVPFVSPEVFRNIYWATCKPIIEDLWAHGHQTLFYAEGKWDRHLDAFAELPERSIVFHVDRGDIALTKRVLGDRFCISGGLSNVVLAHGTPDDVRRECRKILDTAARDGGYIMDAGAIVQNDARVENVRAMTDFTREHGVYSRGSGSAIDRPPARLAEPIVNNNDDSVLRPHSGMRPGVAWPWEHERERIATIKGDESIARRVWEDVDRHAYGFIWQVLLSF